VLSVFFLRLPEEEQAMGDHAEQDIRSEAARVLVRERLTKERREAELLRLARGEIADAQA
jgi:large subunit ribosomal protein MRP49